MVELRLKQVQGFRFFITFISLIVLFDILKIVATTTAMHTTQDYNRLETSCYTLDVERYIQSEKIKPDCANNTHQWYSLNGSCFDEVSLPASHPPSPEQSNGLAHRIRGLGINLKP